MKKAVLLGLVAVLLVLAGCSDDKATTPASTADGKKVVAAMSASLVNPEQGIETGDATCIATRFVNALGVKKLVDAQVVSPQFGYTSGTAEASALAGDLSAARKYCLEEKVATSLAASITTPDGLVTKPKDATCVGKNFAHHVGLDRLIAGQAVDTKLGYVANGALQDFTNARSYGDAVVSCLGQDPASSKLKGVVESGYAAASTAIAAPYASCFLPEFVDQVGVPGLFTNRFVNDKGEYAYEGRVYDNSAATALAGLMLGCIDTLKADAQSAAAADKTLDAAALEACAKRTITPAFLRDKFLVNQLLGRVKQAQAASKTSQQAFQRCVSAQK